MCFRSEMPQPEAACGSDGDGDSQPALSDTQSEPSSEELSVESAAAPTTPTASPSSHKPKRRSTSTSSSAATPPAPLVNPLQFIKVKPPTHLYTSAPVEKPVVERIRKEEPEDWQNVRRQSQLWNWNCKQKIENNYQNWSMFEWRIFKAVFIWQKGLTKISIWTSHMRSVLILVIVAKSTLFLNATFKKIVQLK